jgi:uncharacterized membrane protein
MANQPQQQNNIQQNSPALVARGEILSGPIPDPETLERYKNADPSFPERIMKMAEAHNAADVKIKNRVSLGNLIIPVIGQVFTVVLAAGGTLACIYLAKAGYTGPAIASIAGSYSPIIIGAFKNLRPGRK